MKLEITERDVAIAQARIKIRGAMIEATREVDLTIGEYLSILGEILSTRGADMIRMERKSDEKAPTPHPKPHQETRELPLSSTNGPPRDP